MKQIVLLLVISITSLSCKKENIKIISPTSGTYQYGSESIQNMEIHIPKFYNETKPLFLVVHGGGWESGDKHEISDFFDLLKENFSHAFVANLTYRLCEPGNPIISEQLDDIHSAINWFKMRFPNWKGKTYLLGYSAGAHLALMYSLKQHDGKIGGVVNLLGHADFTIPQYLNSNTSLNYLHNVVGVETYISNPQLWESNSPIFHITSESPPILSFYCGLDNLVPYNQGLRLHNKLGENGVTNFINFYPNEGHFDWSSETKASFYKIIIDFVQLYE